MYVNDYVNDPELLWLLVNPRIVPNQDLYIIFDNMRRDTIRRQANKQRDLLRLGLIKMPERDTPYEGPEAERERVREKRERASRGVGKSAMRMVRLSVPEEHVSYHERLQEALNEHGPVSKARFSDWQSLTKNTDGEAEIHDLQGQRFEVRFDTEQMELIRALSEIKPIKAPTVRKTKEVVKLSGTPREDVACGDPHFGYLRVPEGEMIPMHDEKAISLFHQITKDIQPEKIIIGGDLIDFAGLSRWEQLASFIDTLNPTLERVAQFLDQLKVDCPNSKIILVEGNHDERPGKMRRVSPQVGELLKMKLPGEEEPVLSLPYLLKFKERGITFLRGGNARAQVNERLGIQHRGNSKKSLGRKLISTIGFDAHGSNHPRPEVIETPYGPRTIYHYTLGMLGRIDGVIPSTSSTYDNFGNPDAEITNWIQSFGVVEYLEGDQPFQIREVFTNPHDGYKCFYNGKMYEAEDDL